jgi:hypothetical protein
MRQSTRRGLIAAVVLTTAMVAEGAAFADDREVCAASAEQAQQLRDEGKYRRAREQMLVCARDVCPGPIKSDCGKWLSELDHDAPTVVFGARVGTQDIVDVKVSIDGVIVTERLDGKPVLADSGEHTIKFERADGSAAKEEKYLIRAADKARQITVTVPGGNTGSQDGDGNAQTSSSGGEGSIVPPIVVGGIGVLALGSFAIFGMGGKNDVDDLQKCKPNCDADKVDSARTKLIIADISLGVGIVALGVAAYMFITRPTVDANVKTGAQSKPQGKGNWLRLDGGPIAGGGYAGIGGRF